MMVRNEEKNLPRCLESMKKLDIMDELCVFDTGSTDKTLEIAESYGAKITIPENLDEYFVDTKYGPKINFSKARNASIEPATGDWLLLVDADEEIVGDASDLRSFLRNAPDDVEGVAIQFEDKQKGGTHVRFPPPRIFRKGRIRYKEIVHNVPKFREPALIYNGIKVLHYGFDLSPKDKKEKNERTVGLLMAQLKNNPSDFRVYYYLAQHYGEIGEYQTCIEYCIKYIRNKEYLERFNPSIYYTLVQACMISGEAILADKWLGEAIRELPEDIDIAAAIMAYGEWQKKPGVVLKGATMFVNAYDRMSSDSLAMGSRFVFNYRPDVFVKALFHVATMRLQEGVAMLSRIKAEMKNIPKKQRDAVNNDLRVALAETGVNWTDQVDPPESKKASKKPKGKATKKKG
jgi:glycosyltransferase involved in cell wall biosynthesis